MKKLVISEKELRQSIRKHLIEQEQHHYRAARHQHQNNGQKLGLDQHPDHSGLEKSQNQIQGGMHRIACRNHLERREQQYRRKYVEKTGRNTHDSISF